MEASGVTIKSSKQMKIESTGPMTIKANKLDIDGGPMVSIKGGIVNIN